MPGQMSSGRLIALRRCRSAAERPVFSALVPVLALLYVAGGTMRDHFAQAHKARTAERVWPQFNAARAEITDSDPRLGEKVRALTDTRMKLLEANGVDPMVGTVKALNASVMPTSPPLVELRRQWILLLSSLASLILLAVDALPTS